MRYEDLQTEAEREIWRAEMEAMRGLSGAEGLAAHAVEVHRACHSGPVETVKIRRRMTVCKGVVPSELALRTLVARCLASGNVDVGHLPAHASGRSRQLHRGLVRAYAMTAMQMLVGTTAAARTFGITGQGIRNRSVHLRTDHVALADRVRAFVAAVQAEQKQQEGKAA